MAYQTTNLRAAQGPLPMLRPAAALGPSFAAQTATSDHARILSAAFGTLNRRRARFLRAREALAAAKAALSALVNQDGRRPPGDGPGDDERRRIRA